ncbi:L,D-transpeptidase family protein [Acidithiobacillus sp.]
MRYFLARWALLAGGFAPLWAWSASYPLPPQGDNIVGNLAAVTARQEETLLDIGRRYDLGYEQITTANPGVDPWLPKGGTRVLLPTEYVLPDAPRQGIVINVAAMRLFYYPPARPGMTPEVVTYPIGIGREGWHTPVGQASVTGKTKDPSWTPPASIREEHANNGDPLPAVVPAGPDNPLGQYALRLTLPGYLIHGSNKPWGVGMRVSHGCIRLYPEDISRLFASIPVGTSVRIVNQPWLLGHRHGISYLQAFKAIDQAPDAHLERDLGEWIARQLPPGTPVPWQRVLQIAQAGRGIPTALTGPEQEAPERILPETVQPPMAITAGAAEEQTAAGGAKATAGSWFFNVARFRNPDNAQKVTGLLAQMQPPVPSASSRAAGAILLRAGPYPSKMAAEAESERIERTLGIRCGAPLRDESPKKDPFSQGGAARGR